MTAAGPPGGLAAPLQAGVDGHVLAGAVAAVTSGDRVLDLEAVGSADTAARRPMAPDTLFWIASMTKPITATALMILVDEGRVKVDDPVETYLPEFKGRMVGVEEAGGLLLRKAGRPFTVRNLLTHTAGLPYMSPLEPRLDMLPLAENAALVYPLLPLTSEPGSAYAYSNVGIDLVGRIIEVVSGQPYEEFLRQRLFEPLGMRDTTFWPNAEQLGRLAKSYRTDAQGTGLEETPIYLLTYPLDDRRRGPSPSGGLFSTAPDIVRFCRMILNRGTLGGRRFLSPAAVAAMTSTQTGGLRVGGKPAYGYGYGWNTIREFDPAVDPVRTMGSFGHGGAYCTMMWIDPPHGIASVFMIQSADAAERETAAQWTAFMKAVLAKYGS